MDLEVVSIVSIHCARMISEAMKRERKRVNGKMLENLVENLFIILVKILKNYTTAPFFNIL